MDIKANIPGKGMAQIEVQDGRIGSVRDIGPFDPQKPFVTAAFVDLQLNGFVGINFSDNDLEPEAAIGILPALWKTGVTTFCPTLITNSLDRLQRSFRTLEKARKLDPHFARAVPCYHLEGPYLSPGLSHGCHNPHLMRSPNWDELMSLQEAAGGNIGIVTLAPELPDACELIRKASAAGIIVAIGHTDATPEQIHMAVEAGARISTHFGNGCPAFIHRHQNTLWAQLASDPLWTSLICDGFHLPRDLVRLAFLVKGAERCILVTDAIHVAGLPPGRYSLVDQEIELLANGHVTTLDRRSMAGSTVSMNRAVVVFSDFSGAVLADALRAASLNPAMLLRRDEVCTNLAPGQPANLVMFRTHSESLLIEAVLAGGDQVYAANDLARHH